MPDLSPIAFGYDLSEEVAICAFANDTPLDDINVFLILVLVERTDIRALFPSHKFHEIMLITVPNHFFRIDHSI